MNYEEYIAHMESARNSACEDYFAARPQLFITIEKEKIYEAGFENAYRQQQENIQQLQAKLAESEARFGRLSFALYYVINNSTVQNNYPHEVGIVEEILNETKSQSLQHIQAEAVDGAIKHCKLKVLDGPDIYSDCLQEYAKQLRQQQTSEEHHIYPKGELVSDKPFTIHEDYKTNGSDGE